MNYFINEVGLLLLILYNPSHIYNAHYKKGDAVSPIIKGLSSQLFKSVGTFKSQATSLSLVAISVMHIM